MVKLVTIAVALVCAGHALAAEDTLLGLPAGAKPMWIWSSANADKAGKAENIYLRHTFELPAEMAIRSAQVVITADDFCTVYVNGVQVCDKTTDWKQFEKVDVTKHVRPGVNVIAVEARNAGASAGLFGWLTVRHARGPGAVIVTNKEWKLLSGKLAGWDKPSFDDSLSPAAKEIGPIGTAPWGATLTREAGELPPGVARAGAAPLTAEQARQLIEGDWLFQAGGAPTAARSLLEIDRARQLAERFAAHPSRPSFAVELAELDALQRKLKAMPGDLEDDAAAALHTAVRRVKRTILFRNPLLDFTRILLADGPQTSGHESAHRNGYNFGSQVSRLIVLDGLRPDGVERNLIPPDLGFVMRMDLSFDGSKVVVGLKPAKQRSFHLYEVGIDPCAPAGAPRQLTNSLYDDMDPIYLADGRILFSTSRGNTYVRCLPDSACTVLARCDADGRNIVMISRNNEPDYTPAMLPDGRVLYTRWEYTERPLWRLQKLWTINPDGTGEAVYWGNASAHPDFLWEARAMPGTGKVMFAGVGHHDVIRGSLGIIDVAEGREFPNGLRKVTPDLSWTEVGDGPGCRTAADDYLAGGTFSSYRSPYPLGPEDFLVSAARGGKAGRGKGKFDLYLMDIHGNRELVYSGVQNVLYAQPVRPRPRPQIIPDRVAWPAPGEPAVDGVLFSTNIYDGAEGLPPGKAKFLRVIQMDAKTYSMGFKSYRHSGPTISAIQEDGVKRILGTVPIQADGSVAFRLPPGRAVHFQLLDEHQRSIQIMRSFTGVMPGERRGCLGCHAQHSASPSLAAAPSAVREAPPQLTPPPWGTGVSISYERFCQPILDKYCGRCHQGEGKGRAKLDLTLRGGTPEGGITDPKLLPFKEPYLTLIGPSWGPKPTTTGDGVGLAGCLNVERDHRYAAIAPMTTLSVASRLIDRAMSGKHNGVKIEGEDLLRLIAWVDCNCVYRGDEEVRMIPDPVDKGRFPVPVKTASAPLIDRLQPINDPPPAK